MTLEEVEYECNKYHENMYDWLIKYICVSVGGEDTKSQDLLKNYRHVIERQFDNTAIDQLVSHIKAVSTSTPGYFGEMFFKNKPEFAVFEGLTNEPWRFYPEQFEAIQYPGDLIICAGAGTGKTRALSCKALWVLCFAKASVLVVANTDVARNQIFKEIVWQIENSAFLSKIVPKNCINKSHPQEIRTSNSNYGSIRFCLAGPRGDQVLSIQIGRGGYLILDEAAKYADPVWNNILSRARAGCRVIMGSVPYGAKGNRFERLARTSKDLSLMKLLRVTEGDGGQFAKVHWSREDQPQWSPEVERQAIRDHGPKEGVEYQIYVEGKLAAGEGQVFTDEMIQAAFGQRIPLYKALRIVWDATNRLVKCSVSQVVDNVDVFKSSMQEIRVEEYSLPYEDKDGYERFDISDWVIGNIPAVPVDVGGMDCGKSTDPNVLLGCEDTGHGLRVRWSVTSLSVPYPQQSILIRGLYAYKGRNIFNLGIGFEATGHSISSSIWESAAKGYVEGGVPEIWLSPLSWLTKVPIEDEGGLKVRDENKHEIKRALKFQLTKLIKDAMLAQSEGKLGSCELPACDAGMLLEFTEHGGQHLANDFKFDDTLDHTIEAFRVAWGRYEEVMGNLGIHRASAETIERITIPREERDSYRGKKKMA